MPGGLYAITPAGWDDARLLAAVAQALAGGVRILQYRNPAVAATQHRQATALAALCRQHNVPFIINDSVALAQTIGADGVHLGTNDMPIKKARALLGKNKIIGATCHNSIARARTAAADGASYAAFGAIFPSVTKPEANHCPLSVLSQACENLTIPAVAIGGITPTNIQQVINTGIRTIAVSAALFTALNIKTQTQHLTTHF